MHGVQYVRWTEVSEKLDRLQGADGFARIYDANYAFDLANELSRITVPTLTGAADCWARAVGTASSRVNAIW